MSSPQKENGYTAIANEIMEALVAANLSGHEFRMTLLILRKTYGFQKSEDAVSLSQMMQATGFTKVRCSQVINKLQLQKIVTVTEYCNGIGKKYKFNKDFETWGTVTEKCNSYRKVKSTVTLLRNKPLQKNVTTKETLTKENITKENTTRKQVSRLAYFEDFEQVAKTYPKKSGSKKAAFDEWKKLNGNRPPLAVVLEAIEKQIEWRTRAGPGEFRPEWKDLERWIKKRMWEVELEDEEGGCDAWLKQSSQ